MSTICPKAFQFKYHFFYWFKKNSSINTYAQNDTMILYDKFTTLSSHETFTILGPEFIITTFNTNTRKVIHVMAIYKHSILLFSTFINQLEKLLDLLLTYCPTITMDEFNIDMFNQNSTQLNKLIFLWTIIQWNFSLNKLQQFIIPILITYEQMHQSNNVCKLLLKHIGLTISQYILHSNCHIIIHNIIT